MNDKSSHSIAIKPRCGKRCKSGHPWIFSNEIEHPNLKVESGTLVAVLDDGGQFVGYATYNPHSLISLRILSRDPHVFPGSVEWFSQAIQQAVRLREQLYPHRRSYRLIYADSDGLPGLIVDKYEDYLAAQILTAGMEKLTSQLIEALRQILSPKGIVLRNSSEKRLLENLPLLDQIAWGTVPESCEINENGVRLLVDVVSGQKTGHFFDQADNRLALSHYASGKEVLDLFCHSGAWALHMLEARAKNAIAVDSSPAAIALAEKNASINGVEDRIKCIQADAFEWLSTARKSGWSFDLVVVDPPAFAKQAKQIDKALRGYEDINRQAIHLIRDGGILCSCSCSYFISEEQFLLALQRAAARERRQIQILEIRGQAKDHPILLSMPESRYLKCVIGIVKH